MYRPSRKRVATTLVALVALTMLILATPPAGAGKKNPFDRLFAEHADLFMLVGDLNDRLLELTIDLRILLQPDLVPLPAADFEGPFAFCDLDDGQLVVTVANQGLGPADSSTTRVRFSTPFGDPTTVDVDLPTPDLSPGEHGVTTLNFDIPLGCFAPDCFFSVWVDVFDDLDEQSGMNNHAEGACLG